LSDGIKKIILTRNGSPEPKIPDSLCQQLCTTGSPTLRQLRSWGGE